MSPPTPDAGKSPSAGSGPVVLGREGRVVAVCTSAGPGIPKNPRPEARVGPWGLEGDYHAGEWRRGRNGEPVANHRQVSVVAREAIDAIGTQLGVDIPPGGFGENLLVEGIGDLGDLGEGDRLRLEGGVVLRVTEQNTPCRTLSAWHRLVPKHAYGRRGVLATVEAPGVVRVGASVSIDR